ncbi:MAG: cytochrome c oxidase subunit 3 family protein [Desulfobacula sp.]|jgi:cytochrome c oxidase subunit 3|uniref:cytochrome c oxidase subunit 3 family protein n=1 Tax=Desulfobacula sp. TaxID=2593537 RepID=UPI001DEC7417|nr:cytochrome c oxidase subunit 3 family protein [Desulfobacula sp.]MBT3487502.1 cytochrome c oxidase subunit 3 family protein [Desulfobacula sp.]MBT3807162.1 cytochrome c oxidase subunit 3 family protein [Desulfobacula sp.]MBT4027379.1 cytochrome c oxidase subunit 3 family protein [Desulfobacula sp.]MBT4201115.1 cytochrome c oxidase subunit 3 family protein [Desulfobacula sp.]
MSSPSDESGKKLGMWLFLYTEIILFGGLFVLYAVYFARYTSDFIEGGKELNRLFGVANTIILLISSFSVAASITAIQKKEKKRAMAGIVAALLCGLVFLVNKFFEWSHKIDLGIFPNSEKLLDGPPGQNIFFGLYFVITGLHGIHIILGMTLLFISLVYVQRNRTNHERFALLENSGLYWHLVDLIWIFIFPLFYLVI